MPIVVGLQQRQRKLRILGGEQPRREPGNDGKQIDPRMPPAFISLTRSSTCQQPGRISSRPCGSSPYSSFGRPATAFSATLGITTSRNCHVSRAVRVVHQPRRLIQILLRQMVLEHVRRLNNVIINADQDHVFLVHARFLRGALPYGQQFSDTVVLNDNLRRREVMMARIAPSTTFASVPTDGLGQGDLINLGVAAISRSPPGSGRGAGLAQGGAASQRRRYRHGWSNWCGCGSPFTTSAGVVCRCAYQRRHRRWPHWRVRCARW